MCWLWQFPRNSNSLIYVGLWNLWQLYFRSIRHEQSCNDVLCPWQARRCTGPVRKSSWHQTALLAWGQSWYMWVKSIHFLSYCLFLRNWSIVSDRVMNSLALEYCLLGRHKDAMVLQEKVLEVRRRILPVDDSDIGDAHALCLTLRVWLWCVALKWFRPSHAQPCKDVLCTWKATGGAGVEGTGAGVSTAGSACRPP